MAIQPNDEYRVFPYTSEHDRATILCRSNCGPIQVSISVGHTEEVERVVFRPDSPVYNIQNSVIAGNVIIALIDTADTQDVIVVTFYNNTVNQGAASVSVAFNDLMAADQNQDDIEFTLQAKEGASAHLVFHREVA